MKKFFLIVWMFCSFSSVCWSRQVPFKAQFDFNKNTVYGEVLISGGDDPAFFELRKLEHGGYAATVNVKKWDSGFFDISTFLDFTAEPLKQKDFSGDQFKWRLESRYTLLNNIPFEDMKANGTYDQGVLAVDRAALGGIVLSGKIQMFDSWASNMKVQFANLDLRTVLPFLGFQNVDVDGTLGGILQLTEKFSNLRVKGELHSFNGKIQELGYSSMNLNIDGIYPEIYVVDSQISQTDGFAFGLEGKINLKEPERFAEQIRSFVRKPLVQKKGKRLEWTLKKYQGDSQDGVTEFKYLKRRGEERMGGDSDMLGVERRMEF